jgi:putative membrane protein
VPLTPDRAENWHRVHPVSPFVRGWIALAAIAYVFGRDWFEAMFRGEPLWVLTEGRGIWAVVVLLVVVLLLVGAFVLSWWFTRYQVTEEHVRVNSGILFRQHRQARLDRVQAIDVIQPLLGRIFGLAELKFEVADAGESAVRLAYLPLASAQQLRATILARASGAELDPEHPDETPEAPEQPIVHLSPQRVVGATVLSGATVALAVVVVVIGVAAAVGYVADWGGLPVLLSALVPGMIAVAAGYWSVFSTAYNFRAAVSPDGIRLRYGLLETRAQTVPPGRVQAVAVSQPLLWRTKDWYRIKINVAGYGVSAENSGARTTLLPVGTRDEVMQMLALVLPDPGTEDPFGVFTAGLVGQNNAGKGAADSNPEPNNDGGFLTSPPRVRWLSFLTWRRNGFAVTDTALLARSGRFVRNLAVVPHERTQSMALHQGPVARKLRVADLQLHTTVGPVSPVVYQMDIDVARRLFNEQSARAAAARRHSVPERWLERRQETVPEQEEADRPASATEPAGRDSGKAEDEQR